MQVVLMRNVIFYWSWRIKKNLLSKKAMEYRKNSEESQKNKLNVRALVSGAPVSFFQLLQERKKMCVKLFRVFKVAQMRGAGNDVKPGVRDFFLHCM